MSAFEEFGVMPELIKAVEDLEWFLPTPIQAECIPLILGGGDLMAAAETGSGKTGAFALPILQACFEASKEASSVSSGKKPEKIVMSTEDRDSSVAISEDGYVIQSRSETWAGVRANVGVNKGKYYFEAHVRDEGLCRVGWSTRAAKHDLGTDKNGFGFGGTGKKSHDKKFDEYGEPFSRNDLIGCSLDLDNYIVSFSKNGKDLGIAFKVPDYLRGVAFHPAVAVKNAEINFNFGQDKLRFIPNGFKGIAEAESSHMNTGGGTIARKGRSPLCLILEPAIELAEQTDKAINSFSKYLPPPSIETALLVGGVPVNAQIEKLRAGVDIITGTPGRTIDLIDSGALNLSNVRFFVLDEADRFLDSLDVINKIHSKLTKSSKLQVMMFSATLHSPEIRDLAEKICRYPTWVDLKGKDSVPETVDHYYVSVDPINNQEWKGVKPRIRTDGVHVSDNLKSKSPSESPEFFSEATKLLKGKLLEKVIVSFKMDQALIFVRTKIDADNVENLLNSIGEGSVKGPLGTEFSCAVLSGDRSVQERRKNLQKFKEGEVRFLIATDVAARGIDIQELPYVINYTLPDKPEDYIHRVGRVGRADRIGLAISLVSTGKEKVWYHSCPSRGKSCKNTALASHGGCTIWYDEPEYLKAIETRLGSPIPQLDSQYQIPKSSTAPGKVYGQKRGGGTSSTHLQHAEELRPTVNQLSNLETSVQKSFLALQLKFGKQSVKSK